MSEYFPEPKFSRGRVKVELDLSNYTTKADLKNAAGVDASKFAKKVDLASLKSSVDKLDIDKLKKVATNLNNLESKVDKLDLDKLVPVPVDLSKLSDAGKNDGVKRDVYNAKIKNIEDKISDITNLVSKTILNAKINEVKGEIPSITNLVQLLLINEVKGKILSIINPASTTALTVTQKLSTIQKLVKLKRKLLIMIMTNILLLQNLIR